MKILALAFSCFLLFTQSAFAALPYCSYDDSGTYSCSGGEKITDPKTCAGCPTFKGARYCETLPRYDNYGNDAFDDSTRCCSDDDGDGIPGCRVDWFVAHVRADTKVNSQKVLDSVGWKDFDTNPGDLNLRVGPDCDDGISNVTLPNKGKSQIAGIAYTPPKPNSIAERVQGMSPSPLDRVRVPLTLGYCPLNNTIYQDFTDSKGKQVVTPVSRAVPNNYANQAQSAYREVNLLDPIPGEKPADGVSAWYHDVTLDGRLASLINAISAGPIKIRFYEGLDFDPKNAVTQDFAATNCAHLKYNDSNVEDGDSEGDISVVMARGYSSALGSAWDTLILDSTESVYDSVKFARTFFDPPRINGNGTITRRLGTLQGSDPFFTYRARFSKFVDLTIMPDNYWPVKETESSGVNGNYLKDLRLIEKSSMCRAANNYYLLSRILASNMDGTTDYGSNAQVVVYKSRGNALPRPEDGLYDLNRGTVILHEMGHAWAMASEEYNDPIITREIQAEIDKASPSNRWSVLGDVYFLYKTHGLLRKNCVLDAAPHFPYPTGQFKGCAGIYLDEEHAKYLPQRLFRPTDQSLMNNFDLDEPFPANLGYNIPVCASLMSYLKGGMPKKYYAECNVMPYIQR